LRFGEEDNFWGPAGETGPCGPCSEIHYDLGEGIGCGKPDCRPNCDCGRFIEIWNLVFTQYDQQSDGRHIPLPKPNIDTGMGLERTAAAMQGKASVYETDLFAPLIDCVANLAGKRYGEDEDADRAMRIVAEHARAIAFLIADGVMPSNKGRGYVLHRVLCRAALFGRKLGLGERFLGELAKVVIEQMGREYPELERGRELILRTIEAEETRFGETLDRGLNLLDGIIEEVKVSGKTALSGEDIFKLYDTYGFPVELTAEIAAENGLSLDLEGFEREMERQRERARAARKPVEEKVVITEKGIYTLKFVGDKRLKCRTRIWRLLLDGKPVKQASEGQEISIYLDTTPFYGEMGGQVGDTGEISGPHGIVRVEDSVRGANDITQHRGKVVEGIVSDGGRVTAIVDEKRRL
ncbi:MAG: alanine--tRNA ligase, partial [Dehalococcoidia bacterium]|nr:alanine--tRNA ligase [Dehalococcoidia bacterium]